jgi:hypothetical protein
MSAYAERRLSSFVLVEMVGDGGKGMERICLDRDRAICGQWGQQVKRRGQKRQTPEPKIGRLNGAGIRTEGTSACIRLETAGEGCERNKAEKPRLDQDQTEVRENDVNEGSSKRMLDWASRPVVGQTMIQTVVLEEQADGPCRSRSTEVRGQGRWTSQGKAGHAAGLQNQSTETCRAGDEQTR